MSRLLNKPIFYLFIFLIGISGNSFAAPRPSDPKYVKVGKVKPLTVKAGGSVDAVVSAEVENGYHIQANPPSAPELIATTLLLDPNASIEAGAPVYPAGQKIKLQSLGMEISSYVGKVDIKLPLKAKADAKKGKVALKAKLKYQACNEKTCYFPMVIEVPLTVTVK